MSTLIEAVRSAGKASDGSQTSRAYAVAAAMELIALAVANPGSSVNIGYELDQLSSHADKIQDALRAKGN